jgi:hypothetical protein
VAAPSVQLALENALKSYITGITLFSPTIPIHAGHATESETTGTYLAIMAEPPDYYTLGGYNAQVIVTFRFATQAADPDDRTDAAAAHAARTGALIDLLSQQRFNEVLAALTPPAFPFPDNRAWKGLGFSSWEEEKRDDSRTQTEVVTDLSYEFVVHLES